MMSRLDRTPGLIMKIIKTPILLLALSGLLGCQGLQGEREGDTYHSPAAAYSIDLGINTFRGNVLLDERCDSHGGSTTFWDGSGRMFRVDYMHIEGHPMIRAPRFASDMTLLNLVLNSMLREVVAPSELVTSAEAAHREFLQDTDPRALFAVISIDVDHTRRPGTPEVSGTHYYGFLLFKQGEKIYVVQHRQPVLMPEKMKSVLLRLADGMEIPGEHRDESDMERLRRTLARMTPGRDAPESRLCETQL